MFKLAAFSDEISQDLAHACRVCREYDVEGVEIRSVWDTPVQDLTPKQVGEVGRVVADHGMRVCSVGSPFGKCDLDHPAEVADHMDILRRCADMANEWECAVVRGFAFWKRIQGEKPWEAMIAAFAPVPAILEEKGVVLGLENEHSCYVGTAGHARCFLDRLGCPRVKVVWDPANHVHDPDAADTPAYPDGYACIREDICHVHMKDAGPGEDGRVRCQYMGQGVVDWQGQFQALKDDGYAGHVSLETHVRAEDFPEALRDEYGQHLTGGSREGASRVCLAWARDAVARLT